MRWRAVRLAYKAVIQPDRMLSNTLSEMAGRSTTAFYNLCDCLHTHISRKDHENNILQWLYIFQERTCVHEYIVMNLTTTCIYGKCLLMQQLLGSSDLDNFYDFHVLITKQTKHVFVQSTTMGYYFIIFFDFLVLCHLD